MLKNHHLPRLSLIALAVIQCSSSFATPIESEPLEAYTYSSRGTGQFLAGSNQQLGGFADGMVPLWQRPNQVFFADGTVLLGQNQRQTYSGGLGYRRLHDGDKMAGIWGVYSFVDYFHTDKSNEFWLLNPGVEWLSTDYEARLQGYFPLNGRTKTYQTARASNIPQDVANSASQMTSNFFGARGRRVFDSNVALVEQIGPGVELEVGKSFTFNQMKFGQSETNRAWFRVGGYHYNIQNNSDVYGIQANIEAPLNRHVSLIVQNNYDNQNDNRFSVGLRASFGGSDAPLNTAQSRMMDPIIRHQARQSYGEATPKRLNFVQQNEITLIDNGWFFSPNGTAPRGLATTLSDCTAENPCLTIDSETALRIQQLDPQANLLFETGSYLIPENSPRIANLWDGQSVLGRETGWVSPASGATRPEVLGGLFWGDASDPNRANSTGYIEHMVVRNENQVVSNDVVGFGAEGSAVAVGAAGNMTAWNTDTFASRTTDGTDNARAYGVLSSNANVYVTGGHHESLAVSNGDGFARSRAIQSSVDAMVENANSMATARSFGIQFAGAEGVLALNNAEVIGGMHSGEAYGTGDVALASGVRSFGDLRTEGIDSMALANGNGTTSATAIATRAEGELTAIGGTHHAESNALDGNAFASGVLSNQAVIVENAVSSATTTSSLGVSNAVGVQGTLSGVWASGGSYMASANSTDGFTLADAIFSEQVINVQNANTSAMSSADGSGTAGAFAIRSADNNVSVIGGNHQAESNSVSGVANARGFLAGQDVAVSDSKTSAIASSSDGGSSSAQVIQANNDIIVSGGSYSAESNSVNASSNAIGFFAGQDVFVSDTKTSAIANSNEGGTSSARTILANNDIIVSGGSYSAEASSLNGGNVVLASGLRGVNNVFVQDATINVSAMNGASSLNYADASGVNADNNSTVINSIISVTAIDNNENPIASATGVRTGNNATVTNSNVDVFSSGQLLSTFFGPSFSNAGVYAGNDAVINNSSISVASEVNFESSFFGGGLAEAFGVLAENNVTINGGSFDVQATSSVGSASAYGVQAEQNVDVTNANIMSRATSAEDGDATADGIRSVNNNIITAGGSYSAYSTAEDGSAESRGLNASNNATANGGSYQAEAVSSGDEATAIGIDARNDAFVTDADTSAMATSGDDGDAFANGIDAFRDAIVSGGIHSAQASTVDGDAISRGIESGENATINGASTTAESTSSGTSISVVATGVSSNNVNLVGGVHSANATSDNANTVAEGISAPTFANVGDDDILTIISATADNGDNSARAFGVNSPDGDIINTEITVDSNGGTESKCNGGIMSSDGSCT